MWNKQATEKAKQTHDQNAVKTKYDNAKPMAAGRFMTSFCTIPMFFLYWCVLLLQDCKMYKMMIHLATFSIIPLFYHLTG